MHHPTDGHTRWPGFRVGARPGPNPSEARRKGALEAVQVYGDGPADAIPMPTKSGATSAIPATIDKIRMSKEVRRPSINFDL
jgi:hypothetical protein